MPATAPKYPRVRARLSGGDGNVFYLIGVCRREAGVPESEIEAFTGEATRAESYEQAMKVMMRWFDVT